jgi:hypothetical protein
MKKAQDIKATEIKEKRKSQQVAASGKRSRAARAKKIQKPMDSKAASGKEQVKNPNEDLTVEEKAQVEREVRKEFYPNDEAVCDTYFA